MKTALRITKIRSPDELRRSSGSNDSPSWARAETETAAFEAHKTTLNARQRKGAPLALRLSCGVAAEQDEAAGSRPHRSAPSPRDLLAQARDWAESWAGPGAVFSARCGATRDATVELLVAPVRESRGKPVISTQKALTELVRQTREMTEYGALQTSWARWCATHLDPGIQRAPRKETTPSETPPPASPLDLEQALLQADLSLEAAGCLSGLLRLKTELARQRERGRGYTAPEGSLRASELKRPSKVVDPWPFIWSIRAPAQAVIDAAWKIGIGLHSDDPDYEGGRETFPDLEDRIRLAVVVATCGYHCAETEARVKSAVFDRPQRDPDTFWPQGALQEVRRHQDALEGHLAGKTGCPTHGAPRPAKRTDPFSASDGPARAEGRSRRR